MTSHINFFVRVLTAFFLLLLYSIAEAQDTKPRPTGSISGHVSVNGKGAAGIEVGALGVNVSNRRVPSAQTKTDSEGYYHLDGLAAGTYQVMAFAAQLTIESNSESQFGQFPSAKQILLADGENVTDIDIKLVRGGVITGRVTDADNKPVIEERISLEPVEEPGSQRIYRPLPVAGMYQTDDRGIYRIYGLSAGRYRVSAGESNDRGFVGRSSGYYRQTFHPDVTDRSQATVIDLAEGGEAKNVDIRLGRTEDTYNITGRIIDAVSGLPVSSARVGILISNGAMTPGGNPSGPDGKFVLSGLTPGHYGVYVSSDFGDNEYYSEPVFLDLTDKDVSGVEIKALHGLTISGNIATENIELKELLKQVPGLRVSASIMPSDGRMTPTTIRSFGTSGVSADGSFTIGGLRPGRVMLSVMSNDPLKRPSVVKITAGGVGVSQGFEIEAGGQPTSGIQILLSYGTGAIKGSVAFQGAPLSNYRVQIICRRGGARNIAGATTLDARGHFLIRQLAPGVYDCELAYMNIAGGPVGRPPASRQSVNVDNGMEAELNFVVDLTPKGVGP